MLSTGVPLYLAQLELPEHLIGDRAVRALVEALLFGTVRCPEILLYKCQLGDAAAQALACYVEQAPKPGVQGLHLSHNYFSPIGVKLLVEAARRSKMYPIERQNCRTPTPLWLRVDHQLVYWKGFTGLSEIEQLTEAEKRVEELGARLLAKSQAEGIIPNNLKPWELPRLICIPSARGPQASEIKRETDGESDDARKLMVASPCAPFRCKFATRHGPLVHLPYFWMQDGPRRDSVLPEAASLHVQEPSWKTWKPRLPIRDEAAREAAVAAAKAEYAEALANPPIPATVLASSAPTPQEVLAKAAPAAAAPVKSTTRGRRAAKHDDFLKPLTPMLRESSSSRSSKKKVKKEKDVSELASFRTKWLLSGSRRHKEIDLDDDGADDEEALHALSNSTAAIEERAMKRAALEHAQANLQATEASLAAEQALAEARLQEALAALDGKAGAPGKTRRSLHASRASNGSVKRQRVAPDDAALPQQPASPLPAPAEETVVEGAEQLEEMEEEVQEDEDEELELID
jgi:hypothetical protein